MLRWIKAWREERRRVRKDAGALLTFIGEGAYPEARTRAREHRAKGDRRADRHWSRVAVEIARRTGHVIGESTADRFLATAAAERPEPKRTAIAHEFVEISEAIGHLARGSAAGPSVLHNAEAAVHRLVALVRSRDAEDAGRELRLALRELASACPDNAASIKAGMYPPSAEKAALALQRLRRVALPAS